MLHKWVVVVVIALFGSSGAKNFFHSAFNVLEVLIPSSDLIKNEKCRNHTRIYLDELHEFTLWATKMFDATAKFPDGILVGSTYSFGNFDECMQVKVPIDDGFLGKYCLAKIDIDIPESLLNNRNKKMFGNDTEVFKESTWEKIEGISKDRSKTPRNEIHWAFCIPSSCTNEDLQIHLQQVARNFGAKISVTINERDCQIEKSIDFNLGDIIVMCTGLMFLFMVIATTIYEYRVNSTEKYCKKLPSLSYRILISFSMINNFKKLGSFKKDENDLHCIHGLKVYSMCLIIMGHRIMFSIGSPIFNADYVETFYGKIEVMVLLNGPIIVDTFFNISGFLASYLLIQEFSNGKCRNFLMLYIHRLIRLTPVYAIVLAFYCTLFIKFGSGPMWEERIGTEQARCLDSWWANLLYINNYVNTDKMCMFQSWYITCDMHLFIITPFIVWLLCNKPRFGIVTLGSLIFLTVTSTFLVAFLGNLDAILLLYRKILNDPISDQNFKSIYIPTHTRATPYLVGIAAGYLMHKIKTKAYTFPKIFTYVGWILAILIMESTVYFAVFFYIPGNGSDQHLNALYAALHHFTWSISISWFILAISTGNGSLIKTIMCWKPLIVLSRITYAAFLCHGGIQLYTAAMIRMPFYCSVYNLVWYSLGDIVLAYTGGLILTCFFESPIIGIEKIILQGGKVSNKPSSSHNNKQSITELYIPQLNPVTV